MVKNTQIIRRQQPTNCLNVFDQFVGWRLKGSQLSKNSIKTTEVEGLKVPLKKVYQTFLKYSESKILAKSLKNAHK